MVAKNGIEFSKYSIFNYALQPPPSSLYRHYIALIRTAELNREMGNKDDNNFSGEQVTTLNSLTF